LVNHAGELGSSMLDRAHERVQHILAGHQPAVPEAVVADLSKFLEAQADGHS
jgi:hypothetical protein